jgi:hypothetical protein
MQHLASFSGILPHMEEPEHEKPHISTPAPQAQETLKEPPLKYGAFLNKQNSNRPEKSRIKDPRKLEELITAEHNICHPNLLMGLLYEESRLRLDIGCNTSNACGPAQMKEVAVADALMILYASNGRFSGFRKTFDHNLEAKRAIVDKATDGYFSLIQRLYSGVVQIPKTCQERLDKEQGGPGRPEDTDPATLFSKKSS